MKNLKLLRQHLSEIDRRVDIPKGKDTTDCHKSLKEIEKWCGYVPFKEIAVSFKVCNYDCTSAELSSFLKMLAKKKWTPYDSIVWIGVLRYYKGITCTLDEFAGKCGFIVKRFNTHFNGCLVSINQLLDTYIQHFCNNNKSEYYYLIMTEKKLTLFMLHYEATAGLPQKSKQHIANVKLDEFYYKKNTALAKALAYKPELIKKVKALTFSESKQLDTIYASLSNLR